MQRIAAERRETYLVRRIQNGSVEPYPYSQASAVRVTGRPLTTTADMRRADRDDLVWPELAENEQSASGRRAQEADILSAAADRQSTAQFGRKLAFQATPKGNVQRLAIREVFRHPLALASVLRLRKRFSAICPRKASVLGARSIPYRDAR